MKLRIRPAPRALGLAVTVAVGVVAGASQGEPARTAPKAGGPVVVTPAIGAAPIAAPAVLDGKGKVTDFLVSGFGSTAAKGKLEIKGTGSCRFRADVLDLSKSAQQPAFSKMFNPAVALPQAIDNIGPLGPGKYRAYLISYDDKNCPIQGPNPKAGGWYVDFDVAGGAPPAGQTSSNGSSSSGGAPASGGGGGGGGAKPATGKIVSMVVPGGSFAEDDTQKIQVNGQGGCALDLAISNQSYGGSYNQTSPVLPVKLDSGAMLYNGTHFGTLGEGSYHATATGKSGCSGTAAIDFKVTAKTSTKKVLGKPTLSFDKQPKSGSAFSVSKDSNIWFKVTVPQSIKSEPNATCCDVEFDFMNEFGGWEPLPNSPFSDSSWGLAVSQQAGIVNKSVSGFTNGTRWRMKVRAYKYKTEFEWSDWVEFQVDQH